jgi:stalled ribosome alternative rescue factor ArfA
MEREEKILFNMSKSTQRDNAKAAGFYDGRFRHRVVESKKRKAPKYKSRLIDEDRY